MIHSRVFQSILVAFINLVQEEASNNDKQSCRTCQQPIQQSSTERLGIIYLDPLSVVKPILYVVLIVEYREECVVTSQREHYFFAH